MFDELLKNKQNEFCLFTDGQAIQKKPENKKLKNFPAGYLGEVLKKFSRQCR